jgi:hypothetical protein
MGLVFCDGFDSYGATADLSRQWTVNSPWAWSSSAGRNGGGCIQCAPTGGQPSIFGPLNQQLSIASGTPAGLCFWIKISAKPSANNHFLFSLPGASSSNGLYVSATTGSVGLDGSGDVNLYGVGPTNICDNAWHWLEFYDISQNNSTYKCFVDGIQQFNASSTTQSYTKTGLAFYALATNGTITIDDVIVFDNSSPGLQASNIPIGAMTITTKRPSSDSSVQFTPDSGGTNYNRVNEAAADDDTSYVQDNTSGHADTYGYGALGYNPSIIYAANVVSRFKNPGSGQISGKTRCISGGTTSDGTVTLAPASYQNMRTAYNQDPHTSANWTQTNLDAATFGIAVQ